MKNVLSNLSHSENRQQTRQIRRITWLGLSVNLGLALIKFVVGFIGNSQAVVADAIHSLSDMITDFAILFGVKFWSAPADEDHPYGHKRIETIVTILIGLTLMFVALEIGYTALTSLREADVQQPGEIALVGALVSILFKEVLYRWTVAAGKRLKSPALKANAWHHRSDVFSSLPVLLAVTVAIINPEWAFVDHLGAFVVSLFILKVAWDIIKPALFDLTDTGASHKEREFIRSLAMDVEGVQSVHKIRTRKLGASFFVDLHVLVDENMTVRESHSISENVQQTLIEKGPDIVDVVVHIEPFRV
ncbi:cation diffusion facilitator family transporter [candidate division KSB3 bacterium]|uniref:Cation diffusion facilitator family transporter n=1 Tax=candidate division KSB3 bacterium TaxID=2044937 RepID=A0A9D5JZ67_9BACT|nr:cation diffusion facilitator family transporter [candidate division KSB3 bacterium]MBD3327054.1 cation diffusion facilitator family transporter [candidate division KSB3 bacterium]